MATFYEVGTHRIIYKAAGFTTGLTVTAYIWDPSLTKSSLQALTEISDGLYYLDYNFTTTGTFLGKFFEGGVAKAEGVFRVNSLLTDLADTKAKTDNLPSGIAKNVALPSWDVYMVLSSDHVSQATEKTVTGEIRKDAGAFASIANAITEVGSGVYTIADGFTQSEMNADKITLVFSASDCDQRVVVIYPT